MPTINEKESKKVFEQQRNRESGAIAALHVGEGSCHLCADRGSFLCRFCGGCCR